MSPQNNKNLILLLIVSAVHTGVLGVLAFCVGDIKRPPREVVVKVNLNSGELMTAPEVGEPEIKAGGNPPAPEPPAPEPPVPEPPKPDPAIQQRKIAEQQRKKQIAERNRKLAERRRQQRKKQIAERNRKLAEQQRKKQIAERNRQLEERRRQQLIDARNRKLAEQRKRNSGVHHDSSWDNPNNIPTGNRNRGQRKGEIKPNPKIGGDSRAEDQYFAALPDWFKDKWSAPPGILAGNNNSVIVQLEVAADGRLLRWRLVERSSSQAVNASVEQMLRQLTRLPAPPNGAIKFKLRLNTDLLSY